MTYLSGADYGRGRPLWRAVRSSRQPTGSAPIPASPPDATGNPSWGTVLATTIRLWLLSEPGTTARSAKKEFK